MSIQRDFMGVINVKKLVQFNITLNQYFILQCLCFNKEDELLEYTTAIEKFEYKELVSLEKKGFFINNNTNKEFVFNDIILTSLTHELFDLNNAKKWFMELWETFPRATPKGRVLKQISKLKASKKYYLRIKTESEHINVISALRKEILHRTVTGNLEYMQNLETWLNNEGWVPFLGETTTKPKNYGNEIE